VASVSSAPVFQLVEQALTTSDNQTAENLFRLAGRAGGFGGSFTGGGQAVAKALDQVGISAVMANFSDGSGLSRENHLTVTLLTDILRRAVRSEDGLWPIASGLAVAGVNGTLRNRFATPETSTAAGWLRGKTGTLNYVSSLAGFVQSRSGRVLLFASIGNEAMSSFEAGAQIDQIIAAAADCGCPGEDR
jgi:D-alanyl-D-alanine carboxypeptidase/D-alanyl-D-alanine-endopeptidase (penicillin-binding protein 4)